MKFHGLKPVRTGCQHLSCNKKRCCSVQKEINKNMFKVFFYKALEDHCISLVQHRLLYIPNVLNLAKILLFLSSLFASYIVYL